MARSMRWGWVVAVGALAAGCAVERRAPPVTGGVQVGVASWYGPGFHGNRTANGEIYDQFDLTAAHPSLPLGTRAMVTNLSNGRSVEVRINDRGPFVGGRAIDLSYGAARVLRMVGPGTATVRIEVLGAAPRLVAWRAPAPAPAPPSQPPPAAPEPPAARYAVEVASLGDPAKADHLRGVLATRFPDAHVSRLDTSTRSYYRVRVGPYPQRGTALARAELVNRLGYPAVITEESSP
jgi:rare lipoprotein A